MSKEKIVKLTKYAEDLKSRLSGSIPEKHKDHPNTYKQFLNNELSTVTAQLDKLKLDSGDRK